MRPVHTDKRLPGSYFLRYLSCGLTCLEQLFFIELKTTKTSTREKTRQRLVPSVVKHNSLHRMWSFPVGFDSSRSLHPSSLHLENKVAVYKICTFLLINARCTVVDQVRHCSKEWQSTLRTKPTSFLVSTCLLTVTLFSIVLRYCLRFYLLRYTCSKCQQLQLGESSCKILGVFVMLMLHFPLVFI